MSVAYQVHAIEGLGRAVRASLSNLMPPTPFYRLRASARQHPLPRPWSLSPHLRRPVRGASGASWRYDAESTLLGRPAAVRGRSAYPISGRPELGRAAAGCEGELLATHAAKRPSRQVGQLVQQRRRCHQTCRRSRSLVGCTVDAPAPRPCSPAVASSTTGLVALPVAASLLDGECVRPALCLPSRSPSSHLPASRHRRARAAPEPCRPPQVRASLRMSAPRPRRCGVLYHYRSAPHRCALHSTQVQPAQLASGSHPVVALRCS